jgi:predicted glycogen debranching enzyme
MRQGENTTVIQYKLMGPHEGSARLEVRLLIAFRDYHSTTHENGALNADVQTAAGLATVEPYRGLPALHIAHNANALQDVGCWYRNFEYDVERERGLDFVEDLFSPFVLRFDLRDGAHAAIIASTERHDSAQVAAFRQVEIDRRNAVLASVPCMAQAWSVAELLRATLKDVYGFTSAARTAAKAL